VTASHDNGSDTAWFRRFRFNEDQMEGIRQQVELNRRAIADEKRPAELLQHLLELAWALTPLDGQDEAAAVGQRAVDLARTEGLASAEIEGLLHTATALQYSGDVHRADEIFEEAIRRVHETCYAEHLHYLLHHRGRLRAELLDPDEARLLFEEALRIRRASREPLLVKSTESALNELNSWCASRNSPGGRQPIRELTIVAPEEGCGELKRF
jgi:tetratricopeptide (TPR) repeat protein